MMANVDLNSLLDESKEGKVGIKDGKISVFDPKGLGNYPRIEPGENVKIYLDGKLVQNEIVINSTNINNIKIEKNSSISGKEMSLEISKDLVKAYLKIKLIPDLELRLQDVKPSSSIKISAKIMEKIYPKLTYQEIMDYLIDNNVKYGYKEDVIEDIINNPQDNYCELVAEGNYPVEGKDARVKVLDKQSGDPTKYNFIASFRSGDVIAYLEPAKSGMPGISVSGQKIEPKPIRKLTLESGKGVTIFNDKAIANQKGRPKVEIKKDKAIVSLVKEYIIKGDIDKSTGNLEYEGDLIVLGSIQDYFNARIGNNLRVHGNIAQAQVEIGGNIFVSKSIIGSQVRAGVYFSEEIFSILVDLEKELSKFLNASEQLASEASQKLKLKLGDINRDKIFNLLLHNKFTQLIPKIKKLSEKSKNKYKIIENLTNDFFNNYALPRKMTLLDGKNIFQILDDKIMEIIVVQKKDGNSSHIFTDYIQNSSIAASGDLVIGNKGCYNSTVNVGGNIVVTGKDSFIRGGDYTTKGIVFSPAIGSHLGRTNFSIMEGIYADLINGTVFIKTKHDNLLLDPGEQKIMLRVDEDGKLVKTNKKPEISKYIMNRKKYLSN